MSNLNESAEWVNGIYQIERTDPVEGGPDGVSNRQAGQLGNRTAFLKQKAEEHDNEFIKVQNKLKRTWIVDAYANENEHELGLSVYGKTDPNSPRVGCLWFSKRFKWYTSESNYSEMAISFTGAKPQFAIKHQYDGVATNWSIITDFADANVATQEALIQHNNDPVAHAALTSTINAKVLQAQTAAEAAMQNGGMYETAAAGIAATANGAYFRVIGTADTALQLYKNNNGSALLVNSLAAKQAIENAINLLNQQAALFIPKTDYVIKKSLNLAKVKLIEADKYVNNSGAITNAAGWKLIRISIEEGKTYTFGGFKIDTAGYWAVWDAASTKLQNGNFQTSTLPVTFTAAATAKTLLITIARPTNTADQYQKLTVNEGAELIEYVSPADKLIGLGEYKIAGSGSLVEIPENVAQQGADATFAKLTVDSIEASAIIINLPSGAGAPPAGVEVNQAWIDTSAGNVIKVKS